MGNNAEHLWSGQVLRTTNAAGVPKQLSFPTNLPSPETAGRSVLVATADFAALRLVTPDYTMQERFVPTDGGTLNFAGVDQITLPALPGDGATAINRNGAAVAAAPRNFANATATMTPQTVTSVEFYNQDLDHYFVSSLAPDIDALDTGRLAGWQRTGLSFRVFPSQAAGGGGNPRMPDHHPAAARRFALFRKIDARMRADACPKFGHEPGDPRPHSSSRCGSWANVRRARFRSIASSMRGRGMPITAIRPTALCAPRWRASAGS
jgi:hypothetical protein